MIDFESRQRFFFRPLIPKFFTLEHYYYFPIDRKLAEQLSDVRPNLTRYSYSFAHNFYNHNQIGSNSNRDVLKDFRKSSDQLSLSVLSLDRSLKDRRTVIAKSTFLVILSILFFYDPCLSRFLLAVTIFRTNPIYPK